MRYVVTWGDQELDSDSLTVGELELVEQVAGHGYGTISPAFVIADYAALLTILLLRLGIPEPADLVAGVTLGEVNRTLKVVEPDG